MERYVNALVVEGVHTLKVCLMILRVDGGGTLHHHLDQRQVKLFDACGQQRPFQRGHRQVSGFGAAPLPELPPKLGAAFLADEDQRYGLVDLPDIAVERSACAEAELLEDCQRLIKAEPVKQKDLENLGAGLPSAQQRQRQRLTTQSIRSEVPEVVVLLGHIHWNGEGGIHLQRLPIIHQPARAHCVVRDGVLFQQCLIELGQVITKFGDDAFDQSFTILIFIRLDAENPAVLFQYVDLV